MKHLYGYIKHFPHVAVEIYTDTPDYTNMVMENAAQHTFMAPCCCFENAPNTDLLFFRQSM